MNDAVRDERLYTDNEKLGLNLPGPIFFFGHNVPSTEIVFLLILKPGFQNLLLTLGSLH